MRETDMDDSYDPNLILAFVEDDLDAEAAARFERQCEADPKLRELAEQLRADRLAVRGLPEAYPGSSPSEAATGMMERELLLGDAPLGKVGPVGNSGAYASPSNSAGRAWVWRVVAYSGVAAAIALTGIVVVQNLTGTPLLERAERLATARDAGPAETSDTTETAEDVFALDAMDEPAAEATGSEAALARGTELRMAAPAANGEAAANAEAVVPDFETGFAAADQAPATVATGPHEMWDSDAEGTLAFGMGREGVGETGLGALGMGSGGLGMDGMAPADRVAPLDDADSAANVSMRVGDTSTTDHFVVAKHHEGSRTEDAARFWLTEPSASKATARSLPVVASVPTASFRRGYRGVSTNVVGLTVNANDPDRFGDQVASWVQDQGGRVLVQQRVPSAGSPDGAGPDRSMNLDELDAGVTERPARTSLRPRASGFRDRAATERPVEVADPVAPGVAPSSNFEPGDAANELVFWSRSWPVPSARIGHQAWAFEPYRLQKTPADDDVIVVRLRIEPSSDDER